MRFAGRVAAVAGIMLAAVTASGCRTSGLVFVQDDAITITSPSNLAVVGQPVTVRWHVKNPSAGYVVFIDTMPMSVGDAVDRAIAPDHVLRTTTTEVKLANLQPGAGSTEAEKNHHQVTVVKVNTHGVRQGEQAGAVEFTVRS